MNRQTQVKNMKVRREGTLLSEEAPRTGAELTELPQKDGWGRRLLRADKLVRNLAVVGAMLLTVIAVKNAGSPNAQSVFGALQASTEMEWDESLGKLSFVGGICPTESRPFGAKGKRSPSLSPWQATPCMPGASRSLTWPL